MARLFLIILLTLMPAHLSFALEGQQSYNLDGSGVALHSYDPVSYYTGKPVKGQESSVVSSPTYM